MSDSKQPNSFVQVNNATSPGKKLAMYEFPDPDSSGSGECALQSEAVTLTTGDGVEILGQAPPERSIPVVVSDQPEVLHNGEETAVGGAAVKLLDSNARRRMALVQNTGSANIRVGVRGVTATTGLRLVPNAIEIFELPDVYQGEVWAIREGGVDSVAFAQEATAPHHHHHAHHSDLDQPDHD